VTDDTSRGSDSPRDGRWKGRKDGSVEVTTNEDGLYCRGRAVCTLTLMHTMIKARSAVSEQAMQKSVSNVPL